MQLVTFNIQNYRVFLNDVNVTSSNYIIKRGEVLGEVSEGFCH